MPNQVQVDFVGNAKPLYATADQVALKAAQSGDAAGKAFTSAYDNQTAAAFARQDAAERARAYKNSVEKLRIYRADTANEIRIEQEAADKIAKIRGVGSQRANAAGRLNLARQGADVFTQLGSGQSAGLVAIQQGPQILDAMALSGFKLKEALDASGKSAAFLVSVGGLGGLAALFAAAAIPAFLLYRITKDLADAEAVTLKHIENQAIARNKALIDIKKQTEEFAKQRKDAQFSRDLQAEVSKASESDLRHKIEFNKKLIELTPLSNLNPQRQQAILESEAQLDKLKTDNAKKREDSASRQIENDARARDQRAAFEQEQIKKRIADAKQNNEQYKAVFESLFQRQAADNPFAKILVDDAKAAENFRDKLKGLTPELGRFAETQQRTLTANALFSARLDNKLNVSDIRQQAEFFRNGQKGESTDDLLKRLGFNPADFAKFNDAQKVNLANQFAGKQAFQFGKAGVGGQLGGVNVADLAFGAFQNAQQIQSNEETPQQRLDRQFKELQSLSPSDDLQRASLDRKITSIAANLDPTSLRQDTRNQVADALERNADRAARQEAEGQTLVRENNALLSRLNQLLEKQSGVATNGGNNSLDITVKPSAGVDIGVTPLPSTPNQDATNDIYPTDGFSFAGGQ